MIAFNPALADTTYSALHAACLEQQVALHAQAAQQALVSFPPAADIGGRQRAVGAYAAAALACAQARAQLAAYRLWLG